MTKVKTRNVREYLRRQPRVGDNIVIVDQIGVFNVQPVGSELTIVKTTSMSGEHVFAYSYRKDEVVVVHDDEYRIFVDVEYEKVGEDHVVKKFLGIPYAKHTVEKWRRITNVDEDYTIPFRM